VLTVEFRPPLRWFGGENINEQDQNDKFLGRPKIDFQVGFAQLNTNKANAGFHQWQVGPMIKTGWDF
jgi:hypothetical protein